MDQIAGIVIAVLIAFVVVLLSYVHIPTLIKHTGKIVRVEPQDRGCSYEHVIIEIADKKGKTEEFVIRGRWDHLRVGDWLEFWLSHDAWCAEKHYEIITSRRGIQKSRRMGTYYDVLRKIRPLSEQPK